jgi:hypothetical protein
MVFSSTVASSSVHAVDVATTSADASRSASPLRCVYPDELLFSRLIPSLPLVRVWRECP